MSLGFTYRGKHSRRDFNIKFKSKTRPIMPPLKVVTEDIPNADSVLDFTEQAGRTFYSDKVLELDIYIEETNLYNLHKKVGRVISWLQGSWGELIFDDMPSVKWIARPVNFDSFSMDLARLGKATVQFRCKPFNQSLHDNSPICLGSDLLLGSDLPIGVNYSAINISNISGYYYLTLYNYGDAPTKPIINITGNFTKISFRNASINNSTWFTYTKLFTSLIIDCEKFACYSPDNIDLTSYSSGDFIELVPGRNDICFNVTDSQSGSGTVSFTYYYNYFYC